MLSNCRIIGLGLFVNSCFTYHQRYYQVQINALSFDSPNFFTLKNDKEILNFVNTQHQTVFLARRLISLIFIKIFICFFMNISATFVV